MSSDTKFSIPSIPSIPKTRMDGMDGIDVFKFSREGGRGRRSGEAETEGASARQVKTGKKFARRRKDFAKPRCSEPRTGFTDARGAARFRAKPRGFEKSIPLTYGEGIDRRVSSGFRENRILRQTAKRVFGNANPLRCLRFSALPSTRGRRSAASSPTTSAPRRNTPATPTWTRRAATSIPIW